MMEKGTSQKSFYIYLSKCKEQGFSLALELTKLCQNTNKINLS